MSFTTTFGKNCIIIKILGTSKAWRIQRICMYVRTSRYINKTKQSQTELRRRELFLKKIYAFSITNKN